MESLPTKPWASTLATSKISWAVNQHHIPCYAWRLMLISIFQVVILIACFGITAPSLDQTAMGQLQTRQKWSQHNLIISWPKSDDDLYTKLPCANKYRFFIASIQTPWPENQSVTALKIHPPLPELSGHVTRTNPICTIQIHKIIHCKSAPQIKIHSNRSDPHVRSVMLAAAVWAVLLTFGR